MLTEKKKKSLVKSVSVLPGNCWCGCYMIQYSIHNKFSVFCKKSFILKLKTFKKKKKDKKKSILIVASSENKKKMLIVFD